MAIRNTALQFVAVSIVILGIILYFEAPTDTSGTQNLLPFVVIAVGLFMTYVLWNFKAQP